MTRDEVRQQAHDEIANFDPGNDPRPFDALINDVLDKVERRTLLRFLAWLRDNGYRVLRFRKGYDPDWDSTFTEADVDGLSDEERVEQFLG